jgi:hypothetical protein
MKLYELVEVENQHVLCKLVEFDDGKTVIQWQGEVKSIVVHDSLDAFKSISVNDNRELKMC